LALAAAQKNQLLSENIALLDSGADSPLARLSMTDWNFVRVQDYTDLMMQFQSCRDWTMYIQQSSLVIPLTLQIASYSTHTVTQSHI